MKKLLLVYLFLCCSLLAFSSSNVGHFVKNVSNEGISTERVTEHFEQWFNLAPSTTFEKVADKTDRMGIRHITYQQYYRGIEVEGCMVLVHARNNTVQHVNGALMEEQLKPQNVVAKVSRRRAVAKVRNQEESDAEFMLTPVFDGEDVEYRLSYKVYSPEEMADIYIDAETGDVLKKISTRYDGQSVQGTAVTKYSGTQSMTCYQDGTEYSLMDNDRGIITYIGSNAPDYFISYYAPDALLAEVDGYIDTTSVLTAEQRADSRYMEYFRRNMVMLGYYAPLFNQYLSIPKSGTPNFAGYKLTTVKIKSINTTSWQGLLESNPDLFITVVDAAGIERYNNKASRVTRTPTSSNPVTFTVNVPIWGEGYKIKIWDYDAIGNDLIATLKLDRETGTWNYSGNTNTTIVVNSETGDPALDAHWGMGKTLDYFSETFGRNSFDDQGSIVFQIVDVPDHVISNGNNAFASTTQGQSSYMVYGMGDGSTMRPVVELDVMAHEYSHQVTAFNQNGGLKYENESGALNEGFSDIFGMCVEYYVTGSASWLIGHDIMIGKTNMRSMKNPANSKDGSSPQPKAYQGANWHPLASNPDREKNDNGGVHTNSSVLNYWFYLVSAGSGNYTNEFNNTFNVQGIGIGKSQWIAYMLNQYYLTQYATYQDAAMGSLIIAELLYGYGSLEYQAVFNAWGVVGIGSGYPGTTYDLEPGKYMVFARRDASSNYFKMSSELTSGSTKRYKGVDIESALIGSETTIPQDPAFIWEVEKSGNTYLLKNQNQYSTWNSGNSAAMGATGKQLTITPQSDGTYTVTFADGSNTRYLSLNNTAGNDYFAYYSDNGQMENLRFEPYRYTEVPEITIKAKKPSNWGSTISAWAWNTGEEGKWVSLEQEGNWYKYTTNSNELNIVFVNGTTWTNDNNQTVDITSSESLCVQIGSNTSGKRTYTAIDCVERVEPTLTMESSAVSIEIGESVTRQAYTNSDAAIVYSSTNSAVASVDNSGKVLGKSAGTATIKASVSQTDHYLAKSVSYVVTVTAAQACKVTPYSETFASSQGDFTIQEVSKASGLSYIWKLDASSYHNGMIAKAMYNSTYYASEGWLISPCIEIPEGAATTLKFDHTAKFFSSADTEMTLWISTNYKSGLPSTAAWDKLNIPTYPSGSNWNFVSSGNIDLSAYAGCSVTIAFKYISTSTAAAQWEVKNFSVTSTPNPTGLNDIDQSLESAQKVLRDGHVLIIRNGKTYTVQGQEVK